jgi:hypothetical protein
VASRSSTYGVVSSASKASLAVISAMRSSSRRHSRASSLNLAQVAQSAIVVWSP